jgi:carboxypeptidase Q
MTRTRLAPLAALACLAAATPLAAQTFPTSDPVIKQIYSIGMDSSQLRREAHVLFDSLGPRLMGTPNIKRAQDWLTSTYKSWGIDAKEEKYGTWRGWTRGYSHIDLVEPRVRSLAGQMVGYSPGTNGRDAILQTIILPRFKDSTEFVKWLPQAKGKLVLISAPMPTCRTQEQWNAFGTPESAAKMAVDVVAAKTEWASQRVNPNNPAITGANAGVRGTGYSAALGGGELGVRLEDGGAGGIITSRPKLSFNNGGGGGGRGAGGGRGGAPASVAINLNLANGTATVDTASLRIAQAAAAGRGRGSIGGYGAMEVFETYNTRTPAIALDCEDYGLVYRLTEAGDRPKLKLNLEGKLLGEQPVFNVVAMVKGSEKPDEYVVLSSHFDSWDGSSGATDNGTGTLTMLEAMRILHQVYPHPKRTIIAGHWSGEEEGEVGSKAFTEDHPEVIKGLMDVFNQDNGTGRIQSIGGGGMKYSPDHVNMWLSKVPTEFKDAVRANVPGGPAGGGSDDFSFTCYGIPTSGLGALGWDYGTLTWHTERDTYDKVVFDDLKFNATFTAMIAYLASEDPTMIPHEKIDMSQPAAGAGGGRGGRGGWPQCEKAPRVTKARLQ